MHGGEAEYRANLDGDKKARPKFQERHATCSAPAIDVSTEIFRQTNLLRPRRTGRYYGSVKQTARKKARNALPRKRRQRYHSRTPQGQLFIQCNVYAVYGIIGDMEGTKELGVCYAVPDPAENGNPGYMED
jgi:hypothetical protein